jgi:phospholipase/carboxylesterase
MTELISGPRQDALSGNTRQLVIFLHGYGANGDDLIDLAEVWETLLPDAAFVSPDAPFPCEGVPFGRQWFPLFRLTPEECWDGVRMAEPYLTAFIDAEEKRLGLTDAQVVLVGFSQGSMMALHVGLRRAQPFAAIVAFSGRLALSPETGIESLKTELKSKPPVFLAHGDSDVVIPVNSFYRAKEILNELNIPYEDYLASGLGHGIDIEEMERAGEFLRKSLGYV